MELARTSLPPATTKGLLRPLGQGLLNYFLRAFNGGAIGLGELKATRLSMAEIQTRSFAHILKGRRNRKAHS